MGKKNRWKVIKYCPELKRNCVYLAFKTSRHYFVTIGCKLYNSMLFQNEVLKTDFVKLLKEFGGSGISK